MTSEMQADILLSEALPEDLETQLKELFRDIGADTRLRSIPVRRGWAEAQWLVLATIPLQAFMSAFVAQTAADSYARMKSLARRLAKSSPHQSRDYHPFVLQDSVTKLKVVLEPDLPTVAFRELADLDLNQFKHGPLHYDRARSQWRSEIDETDQHQRRRRRSTKRTKE
jgi:hypothetical protein